MRFSARRWCPRGGRETPPGDSRDLNSRLASWHRPFHARSRPPHQSTQRGRIGTDSRALSCSRHESEREYGLQVAFRGQKFRCCRHQQLDAYWWSNDWCAGDPLILISHIPLRPSCSWQVSLPLLYYAQSHDDHTCIICTFTVTASCICSVATREDECHWSSWVVFALPCPLPHRYLA